MCMWAGCQPLMYLNANKSTVETRFSLAFGLLLIVIISLTLNTMIMVLGTSKGWIAHQDTRTRAQLSPFDQMMKV